MMKMTPVKDIDIKYNFRIKAYNIYTNDPYSNNDLTEKIFSLRDKYKSIKSIEGTAESCRFLITFNNHHDLENDFGNIMIDINDILRKYLINEGLNPKLTCDDIILFDYSIFSTFIEIRL